VSLTREAVAQTPSARLRWETRSKAALNPGLHPSLCRLTSHLWGAHPSQTLCATASRVWGRHFCRPLQTSPLALAVRERLSAFWRTGVELVDRRGDGSRVFQAFAACSVLNPAATSSQRNRPDWANVMPTAVAFARVAPAA
jgi:hypothetical protein